MDLLNIMVLVSLKNQAGPAQDPWPQVMTLIMINNQVVFIKTSEYINFPTNTHYLIFRRLFCQKKPPEGTATQSKRGWAQGPWGP